MNNLRIWFSRCLIGIVLLWNVQCALVFIWNPEAFAPSFELSGAPGAGMVRGMGVLFLMWNVPYAIALLDPVRRRLSLYEAIAMQTIGLLGESLILWGLPGEHLIVRQTVLRFIAFDGSGLLLLLLAAWVTRARQGSI